MGRAPCCAKVGLNRGPWTPREDTLLKKYIENHGDGNWRSLPKKAGLLRCGKSCRLRWMNYLRPDIKRGNMEPEEDDLIIKFHALLGNRWSLIARRLPGRTDNEIKNYWNTHLSKVLRKKGIDPRTHKPLPLNALNSKPGDPSTHVTEKSKTMKREATKGSKHGTAIKVYVPKANRIDPFNFISKLRHSMVQLESLTQIQETGTPKVFSSPDEGGIEMEEQTPNVEKQAPMPNSPMVNLSSWPELENWINDDSNKFEDVCEEFLDLVNDGGDQNNVDASGFNYIVEEEQECYDNWGWLSTL